MAHQSHNLPWNTLASNLTFIRDNPHITPRRTDLFPRHKPSQVNDLNHFTKCFTETVKEFAITERSKYSKQFKPIGDGKVFSDELLHHVLPWMDPRDVQRMSFSSDPKAISSGFSYNIRDFQLVENWIIFTNSPYSGSYDNPLNEPLALLLIENQMPALLTLCRHPKILLKDIRGGNYQYCTSHMIRVTLEAYICLNVLFCKPELWSDGHTEYRETRAFSRTIGNMSGDFSGDLIYLHHRKFVGSPFLKEDLLPDTTNREQVFPFSKDFNPFGDLRRLKDYLKECFNLFVRYEVFQREHGQDPDWDKLILTAMSDFGDSIFNFKGKTELVKDEDGVENWTSRFI